MPEITKLEVEMHHRHRDDTAHAPPGDRGSAGRHGCLHVRRPKAGDGAPSRVVLLSVLLVAQLMVILDITAVNIALPTIAKDLGISGGNIGWTITSYSLIFGSLLLLGGRAADLLGRRRVFLTGLTVFTVASFASGIADTAATLFAARAGQGLGAAMLSPAALSIITSTFQGRERTKALGAWGVVGGAGAAIGVLLGGVLTEVADWRLIFYINLPVAVVLAVAALKVVPADMRRPQWRGLDLHGALVATSSLAAIVFALSQGGDAGWTSAQTLLTGAAGLAGLGMFAMSELRTRMPLLRVNTLADRAVGGGFLLMLLGSGLLFGLFLLSSLYLQNVLGMGPLATGFAFLPLALAAGVGAHGGAHLVNRFGIRAPLAGAFALASVGLLLLAQVQPSSSYVRDVLPGMLIAGLGLGVALVSMGVAVLTGARQEEAGMLSGLNTTGHEVGGTIGIALFATLAAGGLPGPRAADGIADAFLIAGVLATVASLIAVVVLPPARQFLPKLRLTPQAMPVH